MCGNDWRKNACSAVASVHDVSSQSEILGALRDLPEEFKVAVYLADIEGYPDVGGLFRDTAEAETGHAFGHLDFLKEVGDPATGFAIGGIAAIGVVSFSGLSGLSRGSSHQRTGDC